MVRVMKRLGFWCGCLLATCGLASPADGRPFDRLSLVSLYTIPAGANALVSTADLDLDGHDEIVTSDSTRAVIWQLIGGATRYQQLTFASVVESSFIADANGDGWPDVFIVSVVPDGSSEIVCYLGGSSGLPQQPSYRIGPFFRGFPRRDRGRAGIVCVCGCFDADGNGRPEIYISSFLYKHCADENHEAPGRGLHAFDGATGDSLWYFPFAGTMGNVKLVPGPGDSGPRILLSSFASDNCVRVGDTVDSLSYVALLTPRGQAEWCVSLGGRGSMAILADPSWVERDGVRSYVTACAHRATGAGTDQGSLLLLCPESGAIRTAVPLACGTYHSLLVQHGPRGRSRILAVTENQELRCFDDRLTPLWTARPGGIRSLGGIEDADRDGSPEIYCTTGNSLVSFDARGHLRAEAPLVQPGLPLLATIDGARSVVVPTGLGVVVFRPVAGRGASAWMAGGAALLATLVGGFLVFRRRTVRVNRMMKAVDAQEQLLEAMVAFGHGGATLRILDRLRFHLINLARFTEQGEEGKSSMVRAQDDFRDVVLPEVVGLVPLAKRAGAPAECWRDLVPRILVASKELDPIIHAWPVVSVGRVNRSLEALNAVDRNMRELRLFLERVFCASIREAAERVLGDRSADLQRIGACGRLRMDDGLLDQVFCSPNVLTKTLDNLTENAVRAMTGTPGGVFEIRVERQGSYYQVDVSDAGCGILEKDRERIFDRAQSTREGGGFGLHYARQSLARFGARISVLSSAPGSGTTFRLVFRAARVAAPGNDGATPGGARDPAERAPAGGEEIAQMQLGRYRKEGED